MISFKGKDKAYPYSLDIDADDEEEGEPHEVDVGGIKAQFFFGQPEEELIPSRFLEMAEDSEICHRLPWPFSGDVSNPKAMNICQWPIMNVRYREVFRWLQHVPSVSLGLWEGGVEQCFSEMAEGDCEAQASVLFNLLQDIREMMCLTAKNGEIPPLTLRPRLTQCSLSYLTGYREKHRDGPETDGMLALESGPGSRSPVPILPLCVTKYEEPMETALSDRFKVILGQLLRHTKPLPVPGDKIPDQEMFLLGLHGSRLHLMRAYFPGYKLSSIWCGRELPNPADKKSPTKILTEPSPRQSSSSTAAPTLHHESKKPQPEKSRSPKARPSSSSSTRFYTAENIKRVLQRYEASKRKLESEADIRSFRVVSTREYDLWKRDDFMAALKVLLALHHYLQSGSARCGAIMRAFKEPLEFGMNPELHDADEEEEIETVPKSQKPASAVSPKAKPLPVERSAPETFPSELSRQLKMLRHKAGKGGIRSKRSPDSQETAQQSSRSWFSRSQGIGKKLNKSPPRDKPA
ncbi:hypothetical protein PDE_05701 [Penicillium oxalicum 114-2]|uniref:Uncharacterized protein n=1 Tax=Penicillium oxalicum (strain 114-2 / CGMCC 5302) TaxID=933388 RepID=S7ZKC7_PENO1|nr:hypothetical protein PDE_05701 [Penicillium oxalicum 114-2]